jgi:hypothetical protein
LESGEDKTYEELPEPFLNMTAAAFISTLRDRRNYLEMILRKCNSWDKKQDLLWKIEKLNIFIQEFSGADAYHLSYKKERKSKF